MVDARQQRAPAFEIDDVVEIEAVDMQEDESSMAISFDASYDEDV